MRMANRFVLIVLTAILGSAAQGFEGGLTVTISNGTDSDLLVTAYDLNTQAQRKVLSSEVINGNASIAISIAADASGQGHLAWTATTVDRDMGGCGRGENRRLNNGDTVSVSADSSCGQ